jgi:PAS domain S-box-containing protein
MRMMMRNDKSKLQLGDLIVNWREKICDAIFLSLSILGFIAYIPSFLLSLRDDLPHIAFIDTIAYGIILLITFNKKISYSLKAFLGSIVFYVLGLLLLLFLGPIGAGNLWLLGFSLIAAFTMGEYAAKISFLLNLATQIVIYILIENGIFNMESAIEVKSDIWLIRSVNFIVINLVIVISTTVLARQLTRTFSIQKEAEEKLADSENRMRTIFEQSPLGMMLIRHFDGIVVEANKSLKLLLGSKDEDILNKDWKSLIHPDEKKIVEKKEDTGNWGEGNSTISDFIFLHKNGQSIRTELTIVKVKIGNIREECYLAMIRDITKEKAMQEQLVHNQKMEALGQLAGGMAHDINNVLSGILSSSELLGLPQNGLNDKSLKYVSMIVQASTRASELIKKLLTFSRKGKIVTATLDIHQILNDTVDILKGTIDKKITLSIRKNASDHNFPGDRSSIESAFINLGINASQAMPNGGKIQLGTRNINLDQKYCDSSSFKVTPGKFLQIEIKDTGYGIAEENLLKIFEPFYTTKEQGSGTGLGLSAVYGTIQDHHGIIEVSSEVGSGTTFTILLPCSEESIEQGTEESPLFVGTGTILLVDDEEINRILIKEILETLGYNVLLAQNGLESIDIFSEKHHGINIVLMDMIMPEMNGSEAFYKMKEIDENCQVIISSGYTKDENIEELLQSGLAGFIAKPYTISEISQLLDKINNETLY